MKIFPVAVFVLLFSVQSVFAQLNLSLNGTLLYPGQTCAGVWHYVDSLGNEYALVGVSDRISIVDVTNASNPVEVFSVPALPGQSSLWREVKTEGKFAYAVSEGGGGVVIIDLSNLPASISHSHWYGNNAIAGQLSDAHTVAVTDGYLYVFGSNLFNGGAIIADLSDPLNPYYVGNYSLNYIHDGYIRNDTLWAGEIYAGQFSVIDVTNKSNPALITTAVTPGQFCHNTWLSDDGNFLFTTDERPNVPLGAFDVSDLTNIQLVDTYYTDSMPAEEVHNVRVLNDYLINPSYGSQLTICDAARPHNIIEIANYPTGQYLCWDASPYLPSGKIVATDMNNGSLMVFDPTYIRACYLEGYVKDSVTQVAIPNATVKILNTTIEKNTQLNGTYATGLLTAGTYDIEISKPGYVTQTFTNVSLANGVLTIIDAALLPFTVSANVSNATNGNPIQGAILSLTNGTGTYNYVSDAGGQFNVNTLSSGTYDVFVSQWGFETWCATLLVDGTSPISVQLTPGYYDDFATNEGWNVITTATTGGWVREVPVGTSVSGTPANPGSDVVNDCGFSAYVTGNGGGSGTNDDVDDGSTELISPVFDLSAYANPYIEYDAWLYQPASLPATSYDTLFFYLSNGTVNLLVDTMTRSSVMSTWVPRSIRVTDFMAPTATMQFRAFIQDKPGSSNILEAGLDHWKVTDIAIGIGEQNATSFSVFPNPFSKTCTIRLNEYSASEKLSVRVYDLSGRELYRENILDKTHELKCASELAAGLYTLRLSNGQTMRIIRTN